MKFIWLDGNPEHTGSTYLEFIQIDNEVRDNNGICHQKPVRFCLKLPASQ